MGPIRQLVVVGMGDVTTRYVIPAVAELWAAGDLPDGFTLDLVSRREMSPDEVAEIISVSLGGTDEDEQTSALIAMSRHRLADATDPYDVADLVSGDDPLAVYLALPADVFSGAVDAMAQAGLPDGSRIVFEKPFGTDLASAVELNQQLARCLPDDDVFRVDHFLGKQTVQQIIGTRFSNRVFEAVWDHEHVESVEVVWDETLALEGRAGFYDSTGALRDMVQNHLMQLFCLVAMEPPVSLGHRHVADAKVEVLGSTRPFDDDLNRCSVRARYTAGEVDGEEIPGYADSDGVDAGRGTETFASITVAVDTPRWRGVPFTLRSGKALRHDRHEIVIRFRPAASHISLTGDASPANTLRFGVKPDRLALDLVMGELEVGEGPGDLETRPASLVEAADDSPLGAYSVLLRDVVTGSSTRSVRSDEVEESWRVLQPFLDAWSADEVPLDEYPAGSDAP
ncbi:glucose-6-phosphate dehydrogenase [soil metagenome]